jgi:hypothetical protein
MTMNLVVPSLGADLQAYIHAIWSAPADREQVEQDLLHARSAALTAVEGLFLTSSLMQAYEAPGGAEWEKVWLTRLTARQAAGRVFAGAEAKTLRAADAVALADAVADLDDVIPDGIWPTHAEDAWLGVPAPVWRSLVVSYLLAALGRMAADTEGVEAIIRAVKTRHAVERSDATEYLS